MPYALGIDLGSGRTTAAISRNDRERWLEPEVVALDGDPAGVMSVLHLTDQGAVEVGSSALLALPARAGWMARGVADRIGDEIPVTLAGQPYPAEVLTAAMVGWVVDYVEAIENTPASQLVVTHPAGWGMHRRALLLGALREVNLPEPTLLPRPVAVAESHAATQRVEVGEQIAVHSLGAGRFESAVVRRGSFGFELRAHADGLDEATGDLFDDLLAEHVLATLDTQPAGGELASLRAACTNAKERLSAEAAVSVSGLRVTRAEFADLIRPVVESTVAALVRTIGASGPEPVAAVVVAGGSGRIPLVAELIAASTRVRVVVEAPETSIARGAALAAAKVAKPTVRATAVAMTPEPIARSAVTHTDLMRLDDLPKEDLTDLGPPPPRPPVEIAPLEPPKRRLLGLRSRSRAKDDEEPAEDSEFADLDLTPRARRRARPSEVDETPEKPSRTFDADRDAFEEALAHNSATDDEEPGDLFAPVDDDAPRNRLRGPRPPDLPPRGRPRSLEPRPDPARRHPDRSPAVPFPGHRRPSDPPTGDRDYPADALAEPPRRPRDPLPDANALFTDTAEPPPRRPGDPAPGTDHEPRQPADALAEPPRRPGDPLANAARERDHPANAHAEPRRRHPADPLADSSDHQRRHPAEPADTEPARHHSADLFTDTTAHSPIDMTPEPPHRRPTRPAADTAPEPPHRRPARPAADTAPEPPRRRHRDRAEDTEVSPPHDHHDPAAGPARQHTDAVRRHPREPADAGLRQPRHQPRDPIADDPPRPPRRRRPDPTPAQPTRRRHAQHDPDPTDEAARHRLGADSFEPLHPRVPADGDDHARHAAAPEPRRHRYRDQEDDTFEPVDRDGGRRR
ncbi:Hsp70 family protein [Actinophytocola sediminis]